MERNFPSLLKRHPWAISFVNIGQRCGNPNHPKFKFYGGKDIQRNISSTELRRMWMRDRAYLMKSPSIDRIDSSNNYSFKNCRYIEMSENRKEANDRRSKNINKEVSIEELRDLMCKINRAPDVDAKEISNRFVSPPYQGEPRLKRPDPKQYPKQLSGLHGGGQQRSRLAGNTSGGGGAFGGVSGAYGVATGGSHRT